MLDVLIIGGGPHALTLASLLNSLDPVQDSDREDDSRISNPHLSNLETFKHKQKPTISESNVCTPLSVLVVDTYGKWAGLWESQFTALHIPHLRSHTLVHTDPLNKNALQEFVLKYDRSAELHSLPDHVQILDENAFFNDMRLGKKERRRLNVTSTLKKSLSFSLPGTKLSVDFFKEQVKRYKLDKILLKGTVEHIIPVKVHPRKKVEHFCVELQDGSILRARQVVLATGPTRVQMSNIPEWVKSIEESYPEGRLQHTVHLMHKPPNSKQRLQEMDCPGQEETSSGQVCEAGQRVMVVGGGLTSAHVVSIALQQGADHVTWVMRKHLQLKQFDVGDVESLVGRYSHVEHGIKMDGQSYLRQFYNERSLHKRLAMIRQARKGGAITPEAYIHLQPFIQSGQVNLNWAPVQVNEASWCYRSQSWNLSLSTRDHWTGDRIWLATGCKLDVKQDPLLSDVMKNFPIQVIEGWPCILESLQWTGGCPLYLMGQYSALQVGPHAVNLAGGQAASMRIAKNIPHHQMQDRGRDSEMGRGKSKTEEYIQQMKGLFWL
uniref:Zgc:113276 n=1 Tax=Xiphophorus couchianus TaxID=32473 RepID=A0A3B5KS01_9TELE